MTEKKRVRDMTPEELVVHKAELKARQDAEDEAIRNHVISPLDGRWFTTMDVCALMGLRRATVYALTDRRQIPPPIKGRRANRWDAQEFLRFLKLYKEHHQEDWTDPFTFRKWMEDGDDAA